MILMYLYGMGQYLVMSALMFGNGLMGLPPGPRDTALVRCAPRDALIYQEWASRSEGKAGGKGIDGLAADPEIITFLADSEKAIRNAIAVKTANGTPVERALGKSLPPLIKILLSRPGCVFAGHEGRFVKPKGDDWNTWLPVLKKTKGAVVINGGKQADALDRHVRELLKLLPEKSRKKKLQRQPIPLPNGDRLILHRHKDYFILAHGKGTVDSVIAGLDGKSRGLLENQAFVAGMKQVAFQRTASVSWINVPELLKKSDAFLTDDVKKYFKELLVDTVGPLSMSTGVVDGVIHHRTFVRTNGKTDGIMALVSGRAIKPADLEHIPADSSLLWAFSLNAPKMLTMLRKTVAAGNPGQKDTIGEAIKKLEKQLGASVEKDLFEAFGDVWTFHNSTSAGGFYFTNLIGSIEVRDPQKAHDVFEKFKDSLEEAFSKNGNAVLASRQFSGHTIHYLKGGVEWSLGIPGVSFCLTGKHLLIGITPQALKAHLRFLKGRQKNWTSRIGKDIEAFRGETVSYSYVKSKPIIRLFHAIASHTWHWVAAMFNDEKIKIDPFSLPSARGFLPYVGNSSASVRRTPRGVLLESKSALPIPYSGMWYWFLGAL